MHSAAGKQLTVRRAPPNVLTTSPNSWVFLVRKLVVAWRWKSGPGSRREAW